jgi:hypothetical protein
MRVAAFAATIAFGLGLLLLASGNVHAQCGPGVCQPGESCCDCSKSIGAPTDHPCCTRCGGIFHACCIVGGPTICIGADACCTDAECTGGQICSQPGGQCSCPAGQTLCGGQCVDTRTNQNNCGVCGNPCNALDRCCAGQCVSCPVNGACVGDQSKCACPPARPDLCVLGGFGIGACFNLKTGDKGEGFCGTCGFTCPDGQDCCNGACKNLQIDPANCGTCGGICGNTPGTNSTCCNGVCQDLNNDKANCGGCGHACKPGQHCAKGVCVGRILPPCRRGQHCDSCVCPPGQECVTGPDGKFCALPR